jgi:hypothetical protein
VFCEASIAGQPVSLHVGCKEAYRDRDGQKEAGRVGEQSRLMSLAEATTNVVVGFALAVVTQLALFPMLGLVVSAADNLLIGAVFTAVSLARSYICAGCSRCCGCHRRLNR